MSASCFPYFFQVGEALLFLIADYGFSSLFHVGCIYLFLVGRLQQRISVEGFSFLVKTGLCVFFSFPVILVVLFCRFETESVLYYTWVLNQPSWVRKWLAIKAQLGRLRAHLHRLVLSF